MPIHHHKVSKHPKITDCNSVISSVHPLEHSSAVTEDDWTREYDIALAVTATEERQLHCVVWLQHGLSFLDGVMSVFWVILSVLVLDFRHEHRQRLRWVVCSITGSFAVLYGIRCGAGSFLARKSRCAAVSHSCTTGCLIVAHTVIMVVAAVLATWDGAAWERTIDQEFHGLSQHHARKIWAGFAICVGLEMVRWLLGKLVLYDGVLDRTRDTTGGGRSAMQEPLLWRWLEFETEAETEEARRIEWANRSAQDPLWWSRDESSHEAPNSDDQPTNRIVFEGEV